MDDDVTCRYNNFYEFGTGKGDPANAGTTSTVAHAHPWSVTVEGRRSHRHLRRSRTC
jgi:methionine sulfoxide reductase catalytic subunit